VNALSATEQKGLRKTIKLLGINCAAEEVIIECFLNLVIGGLAPTALTLGKRPPQCTHWIGAGAGGGGVRSSLDTSKTRKFSCPSRDWKHDFCAHKTTKVSQQFIFARLRCYAAWIGSYQRFSSPRFLDCLTLENGTNSLCRNVCTYKPTLLGLLDFEVGAGRLSRNVGTDQCTLLGLLDAWRWYG
jgi:hypothetical protein